MTTRRSRIMQLTAGAVNIGYVVLCFTLAPATLMRPKPSKTVVMNTLQLQARPAKQDIKFYSIGGHTLPGAFMAKH